MKKHLLLTVCALLACFASFAAMSGPTSVCSNTTWPLHYADSALSTGGIFSSSNTAVATIDAVTGYASIVGSGTTTISYSVGIVTSTLVLTIYTSAVPITGTTSVCPAATMVLSCATPGGTWVSNDPTIATISTAGVVTGIAQGYATVYYNMPGGCGSSTYIWVGNQLDSIIAPHSICSGTSTTVTTVNSGGTWGSSNPSVATIAGSGAISAVVTGLSAGTAILSYAYMGACSAIVDTFTISVLSTTSAGTITGPSTVVAGSSVNLYNSVGLGTWTVSPSSVATISSVGTLTSLSAGTALVTYAVSGCGGIATVNHTVTVTPFDGISGHVNFTSGIMYGDVKIWLISYASPLLAAVDSVTLSAYTTSLYYQFPGIPAGTYRIKAAIDTLGLTTGYIPTYHTNSFYWNTATVVTHAAGGSDMNKDIAMGYGAVTSGPGFIGGDVTTGANKGTATSIPSVGLAVYLYNASSTTPLQMTRTDAAGHYAFSNLPVGVTYYTFPEALNYTTTPYTSIALTTATPSKSGASFVQHTLSHTITPVPVGINILATDAASVMAFPNPTTGKVSLTWQLPSAQDAAVTVSDITGREVYTTAVSMAAGAGISQLNLSSLNNGLYIIAVKSADLSYNSKLQVQH